MTEQFLPTQASADEEQVPWPPHQPVAAVDLTAAQRCYLRTRRIADVVVAGAGLVLAVAPMALVSAGVLVTMGRPVLFSQDRITRDGRVFRLRKFRSMRTTGDDGGTSDVDRLLPFGRFLRSTSLDELPSLWNILRGDMSLVGPRPLTTDYLGRFSAEQFSRHAVPAGLTGLAQVSGRNALGWDERLQLDQDYLRGLGPCLDLAILCSTVSTVLGREGVTDGAGVSMSDFPGPQSSPRLTLRGPESDGSWECTDLEGRRLAGGTARVDDDAVAMLSLDLPALTPGVASGDLEEIVRLLLGRLRARHEVEWAVLDSAAGMPPAERDRIRRLGFVRPGPAIAFPTTQTPPATRGTDSLLAFVGFPDLEVHL